MAIYLSSECITVAGAIANPPAQCKDYGQNLQILHLPNAEFGGFVHNLEKRNNNKWSNKK